LSSGAFLYSTLRKNLGTLYVKLHTVLSCVAFLFCLLDINASLLYYDTRLYCGRPRVIVDNADGKAAYPISPHLLFHLSILPTHSEYIMPHVSSHNYCHYRRCCCQRDVRYGITPMISSHPISFHLKFIPSLISYPTYGLVLSLSLSLG
jgi:hypothetical protein